MNPISALIIEDATERALSIETCRAQCEIVTLDTDSDGVESHPDDALILAFLDAATDHVERFTGRSVLIRTYEFALDDFPRTRVAPRLLQPSIEIPYPPLLGVIRFAFGDDSDSEVEEGVGFMVDRYGDKAKLRPTLTWPTITQYPNIVTCQYAAGYASEAGPNTDWPDAPVMPGAIRAALLLMVGHLYANREASVDKVMQELPLGVEALLRPWRVLTGMA